MELVGLTDRQPWSLNESGREATGRGGRGGREGVGREGGRAGRGGRQHREEGGRGCTTQQEEEEAFDCLGLSCRATLHLTLLLHRQREGPAAATGACFSIMTLAPWPCMRHRPYM